MAIRAITRADADLEAVEADIRRLMTERGLTRAGAERVVAVERGYAFVGDREKVPPDRREELLAEEEAAERTYLERDGFA